MKIKEVIQFCEIELGEHPTEYYDKYFNQIINLLKCGEKYEEMCDELIDVGKNTWAMWEEFRAYIEGKSDALTNKMCLLEQKYFSKEKLKDE